MLLAFLIFAFGVVQVLVQQEVISQSAQFQLAITTIVLAGIPLFFQISRAFSELSRLGLPYWIKLQVQQLMMNVFGCQGPPANDFDLPAALEGFDGVSMTDYGISKWPLLVVSLFQYLYMVKYLGIVIWLFDAASFDDAFSGMCQMRNDSLAVWLEDEENIGFFDDGEGRKVISKWHYPCTLKVAIPMILRVLDDKRMDLLKRVRGSFDEQGQAALRRFVEHEESLRWAERWATVEHGEWDEIFKREERFRWEMLDGAELVQELFKLETLKLERKRLEQHWQLQQQPQQQREQPDQHQQPLEPSQKPLEAEFLDLLQVKREEQLDRVRRVELGYKQSYKRKHHQMLQRKVQDLVQDLQSSEDVWTQGVLHSVRTWWPCRGLRQIIAARRQQLLLEARLELAEVENELKNEQQMEKGRLRPFKQRREKLENIGTLLELQTFQSLMRKEPSVVHEDQLMISKVVRNVRLQVVIAPVYRNKQIEKKMAYFITATRNQEGPTMHHYLKEFSGYCDAANAAEFWKLIENLDDNTFVVKTTMKSDLYNPLLLQIDKHVVLQRQDRVLQCEKLEAIVKSVMEDGQKLNAVCLHRTFVSYV